MKGRVSSCRRLAPLLLAGPTLVHVVTDFYRRGDRLVQLDGQHVFFYLGSTLVSLLVSVPLVLAASRQRGRARWIFASLLVLELVLTWGGQAYFFQQYHAYLNADVSVFASNFWDSILSQWSADLPNYARCMLPALVFGVLLVFLGRRWLRPKRTAARWAMWATPLTLVLSFFAPVQQREVQAAPPDTLYLNAVGGLIRTQLGLTPQAGQLRPRARQSLPVPPLTPRPPHPRNVVLVQLESVRADAACIDYDPKCRRTEATNRLFPERLPLRQLRSLTSCTALTAVVLWGGLLPTESREVMHTWPLVFDYARAAGYHTGYFTAQNMMFGNARLWVKNLGVERFVSATDVDPTCDLDMGAPARPFADRLMAEFDALPEPFFALIQLSNVHYPYYIDPTEPQPFQPAALSKAPEDNGKFFNHYQNAIYQEDRHLARLLAHLAKSPAGQRTVIVYTSDHAEAFREHGNMGHTFSVLENEIHVPGWIDAPAGTLSEKERGMLAGQADKPNTHIDLSATILDLLGVWDEPGMARFKTRMLGHSLLREPQAPVALPMTNCGGVWSCAFENWGVLQGFKKLEAREWDKQWHCYDLLTDPAEKQDLGPARCPTLVDVAKKTFLRLPGSKKP